MHKERFQNLIFGPSLSPPSAALAIMLVLLFLILLLVLMNLTALPAQADTALQRVGVSQGFLSYASVARPLSGC